MLAALLGSALALGLQVLLTRLFSVLLWHHLGFFAVSLALLGFAAGGRMRSVRTPTLLAAASLALILALALVVRLPVDPAALLSSPLDALLLLLMAAALAVPFAFLGAVVCASLAGADGRVYAATFAGGALGSALALLAMQVWGAPRAAAVLAALPLLSGALRRPLGWAAGALALVTFLWPAQILPVASRKHFPSVPAEQVLAEEWNAFSRVTFYENPEQHGLWKPSASETIGVAIDAWAITFIVGRQAGEYPAVLGEHSATLAYAGAPPGFDALVIGAGGGFDVLGALAAGAGRVAAVEINPLIVDAVRGRWREFSGGLYEDPRVEVHVAEGRRFLEEDARQYDRIVLAGVDTFAATQAGAFALAENYLYTREAFVSYLAHLKPGGVLFMTRWWFEPPRQELRLALTAADVLGDPRRQLFIARAGMQSLFLLKNGDFSSQEIDALTSACAQRGAQPVYAVGRPSHPVLIEALDATDRWDFLERYPYRVDPTTDDRPFFFENARLPSLFRAEGNWVHDRLGGQEVLAATAALLLLLSLPLVRRGGSHALGFVLLGFGYVLVEVPLMQRLSLLLGHPVLAVAVVLPALLLWSGLGALLARRVTPSRAALIAGLLVALVLVGAHGWLQELLWEASAPVRILGVVAFLALPGIAMGMPFVLLLARTSDVPSAWVWNGLASVMAAPLAVLIAISWGFPAVLLTAAACYGLAALRLARA